MFLLGSIPAVKADATAARTATRMVEGGRIGADDALRAAERWLGDGYRELDNGVFRSGDNARQFRMTASDLLDPKQGMHVHFESIGKDGRQILENNHTYILDGGK